MRSAVLAVTAALAFAPAALAQDPPAPPAPPSPAAPAPRPDEKPAEKPAAPARHENKVTEAAKALFDSVSKKSYNPVALGLKELKGTMEVNIQVPGMEGMEGMEGMPAMKVVLTVAFQAPRAITVEAATDNPMLTQAADQFKVQAKQLFMYSMGSMEPDASTEYDADVVTEKDGKFLVMKMYEKGESRGEMKLAIDANGLPSKGTFTAMDPNMGMEQTIEMTFAFAKEGDAWRLEKQIISHPMLPEPMETALSYTDVGGFKILTGVGTKGAMGMSFVFAYTDLTVNGKKIDLPKPEKKAEEKKPDVATPPAGGGDKKPEAPAGGPK